MTDIEVPTTTIPKAPIFHDQLLKLLIEEQRILIEAEIERIEAEEASALEAHHETKIFPEPPQTNVYVRLTAGGTNNTFGDWAAIVDSAAAAFSAKFATYPGYLVAVIPESFEVSDKVYLIEFAYGAAKTVIGRTRMEGGTNKVDTSVQERMRTLLIPAGETVYYRAACETSGKYVDCHLRYYLVTI